MAAAEKFFEKNNALPTMPEVASRLIRSFDDENISLGAVADLIGKDAALAAKVRRGERIGQIPYGFRLNEQGPHNDRGFAIPRLPGGLHLPEAA